MKATLLLAIAIGLFATSASFAQCIDLKGGCGATLTCSGPPKLGSTVTLKASGLAESADVTLLLVGQSPDIVIPLGPSCTGEDCQLVVADNIVAVPIDSAPGGIHQLELPIGTEPSLIGLELALQYAQIPKVAVDGCLRLSNGMLLRVEP